MLLDDDANPLDKHKTYEQLKEENDLNQLHLRKNYIERTTLKGIDLNSDKYLRVGDDRAVREILSPADDGEEEIDSLAVAGQAAQKIKKSMSNNKKELDEMAKSALEGEADTKKRKQLERQVEEQ